MACSSGNIRATRYYFYKKTAMKRLVNIFLFLCAASLSSAQIQGQVGPYIYNFLNSQSSDGYYDCELVDVVEKISGNVTLPSIVSYGGRNYKLRSIVGVKDDIHCRFGLGYVSDVTSLTIPEGVENITGSFRHFQHVRNINVPSTVKMVDLEAFRFRMDDGYYADWFQYYPDVNNTFYDLERINISSEHLDFKSIDGVLYSKDGKTLILCPRGRKGVYNVPNGVTRLEVRSFYGCNQLTEINLPYTLREIGEPASIDSNGTALGVFAWCTMLRELNIPEGVESVCDYAFRNCASFRSLKFPNTMKVIGRSSCTRINDVRTIDWNNCHLDAILDGAFEFQNWCDNSLPPYYKLSLPMHVKYIGSNAFTYCLAPDKLELSPDLKYIGTNAFTFYHENSEAKLSERLSPIKEIYNHMTTPLDINYTIFGNREREVKAWAADCTLYVPYGCAIAYEAHAFWSLFGTIKEFDATLPEEVGIKEVCTKSIPPTIYDIRGMKVSSTIRPGIYIINGRKFIKQ